MDDSNNKTIMNTQELNNAIRIELNRQDSVVKQLSNDSGVAEHVIRNMMKEKRPVVKKKRNVTAFSMFVQDRNSQGKNNYDNQLMWDSLSSEQKLAYQVQANQHNLEHRYSEVNFIENSEERLNTLKDGLRELKYQCCQLNQECGWDFLVISIEPKEMPDASFGFGSLLADDFGIEHPEEVLQISKKLYQYGESIKNSKLERNENRQVIGNDRLESLIAQTPSLSCQLSSTSEIMDNCTENETESSSSFTKVNNYTNSGKLENLEIETDEESDDDKTVCDDEQDLIDQDPLYELLSQDYTNVHLDSRLKSAVRKFLKARFYADTGKKINIPYKDWHSQTKYSVTGWPKDVKFDDWGKIKEKGEVYRHLLGVHFHINEEVPEYKKRSKKRKLA